MDAYAATVLLLHSRSPTHRALVVAEIVATICQFLQEDDGESLAALARTCCALRTPALEVLWGRLKNLIPIFRLLPPDAWAFHVDEITSRRVYRLERDLVPEDFTTMAKYTPLVKTIGFNRRGDGWPSYEYDVLPAGPTQIMAQCFPQPILFPALRTLDWPRTFCTATAHHLQNPHDACEDFWACACLCIGPKLKNVVIDVSVHCRHVLEKDWNAQLMNFMTRVGTECPQLAEMDVDVTTEWGSSGILPFATEWLSSLVCRIPRLEVLRCGTVPLDGTALAHLGCSSTLKELCVLLTRDTVDSYTAISLDSGVRARFATLQKLDIRTKDLAVFNDLADGNVMFPQVEAFNIEFISCPSGSDVDAFFNVLHDHFSPSRLQRLTVNTDAWSDSWSSNTVLSRACALRPLHVRRLLAFHELRQVDFNARWSVNLNDGMAEAMSQAWPHVETLRLSPQRGHWEEDEVTSTLRSLHALATNCPRLVHLDIPFQADGANIYLLPPRTKQNHPLKRLGLQWVLIDEHVSEVAALLGEIVPNVWINASCLRDDEQESRWLAVKSERTPALTESTEDELDTPFNDWDW
ncbi:predicted protein [Postia placenta Mad-698-R]|nr:predicted protein [Postia placenta Mad-698-R]